jgi:DNA-binding NarL/FixJ family response regulator
MTTPLKTRILVADDIRLSGDSSGWLNAQANLEVIAEATEGDEAVERATAEDVHVAMLDISTPRMTGLQAAREITQRKPGVRVLGTRSARPRGTVKLRSTSSRQLHRAERPRAGGTPSQTTNVSRTLRLMVRVALLDDHPAVLAGLRRLIDSEPDLTVAATATSATELARELDGLRPDVLVVDYDLARNDGLSQCRRIKSRPQPPAVIIYSAYAGPALILAARAAQADGVVDKAGPVPAVLSAIRSVANGDIAMSPVPRDVFEAAVARLDDDDLPLLVMLLDREPLDSIAQAMHTDVAEIGWRAQRIVGRLRPRLRTPADDPAIAAEPSHNEG